MSEANLSIIPFQFEGKPIRVVEQDGELWFVAADVCRVLELDNVAMAVRVLDPDEKGVNTVDTPGGSQQMTVISEPGVYKLLGRSRKPEARRFDRWVRHEVLPSIRKHGGYMVAAPEETPEQLAMRALTVLQATVERQKAQLAVAEPKAEALDRISASGDSLTMTQTAKILGMKQSDMKRWMHANRWAYPQNDSWLAYGHQIKAGRLEYKEAHYTDKETRDRHRKPYCHVTPKGLAALALLIPAKLRTEMPMFAPTLNGTASAEMMQ